jgi:hypothetical protein
MTLALESRKLARVSLFGIRFAGLVLALLVGGSLTGCVSVGVVRLKGVPPGAEGVEGVVAVPTGDGVVEVSICDSPKSKRAGVPTARPIRLDLLSLEQGREKAVESFSGPTLAKRGLAPGTYRLRVREAASGVHRSEAAIVEKDFRVRAGEVTRVEVILKKFPTTAVLIGAGVVAAGVGIAAAASVPNLRGLRSGGKSSRKCLRGVERNPKVEAERPRLPILSSPLPLR